MTDVSAALVAVIFRVKTAAKAVETLVTSTNGLSQDYTNLNDQLPQTCQKEQRKTNVGLPKGGCSQLIEGDCLIQGCYKHVSLYKTVNSMQQLKVSKVQNIPREEYLWRLQVEADLAF